VLEYLAGLPEGDRQASTTFDPLCSAAGHHAGYQAKRVGKAVSLGYVLHLRISSFVQKFGKRSVLSRERDDL
jgi:hypothetical protein